MWDFGNLLRGTHLVLRDDRVPEGGDGRVRDVYVCMGLSFGWSGWVGRRVSGRDGDGKGECLEWCAF